MKKNLIDKTINSETDYFAKNIKIENIKTTNVNILLNRVRQDRKKTIKKRFITLTLLLTIIFSGVIFIVS